MLKEISSFPDFTIVEIGAAYIMGTVASLPVKLKDGKYYVLRSRNALQLNSGVLCSHKPELTRMIENSESMPVVVDRTNFRTYINIVSNGRVRTVVICDDIYIDEGKDEDSVSD